MIDILRPIREEEKTLLDAMLKLTLVDHLNEQIPNEVSAYNPKQLESINLSKHMNMEYGGDILRVEYMDLDDILVTITLTKNTEDQLLDLDFWKEGFLPLKQYPTAEKIRLIR